MKKKAITLLSGGLDSMVAALLAAKEDELNLAITFNYGQRAASREIAAAEKFCKKYKLEHLALDLPWLAKLSESALSDIRKALPKYTAEELDRNAKKEKDSAKAVWVPNRNALFINIAASYAEVLGCQVIVAGFNLEEAGTFPDNSLEFVQAQNQTLKYSTMIDLEIIAPTGNMKKTQMVEEARKLDLDWDIFWSCYEGGSKMCGQCESCARTIRAFKEVRVLDLIRYRFEKVD